MLYPTRQRRNLPRWFLACGCAEAGREGGRYLVVRLADFHLFVNETLKNICMNNLLVQGSRKCNTKVFLGYVTMKYASFTMYT
jgi:hypothetical protein